LLTYTLLSKPLIPKPAVGVHNNIDEAGNFEVVVSLTALFFSYGKASLKRIQSIKIFFEQQCGGHTGIV